MKSFYLLFGILICLTSCNIDSSDKNSGLDEYYGLVDKEISHSELYDELKEKSISELKSSLSRTSEPIQKTTIINRIITEYEVYNADSALTYINERLSQPAIKSNETSYKSYMIWKSGLLARAGLFKDAKDLLDTVSIVDEEKTLKEQYYFTLSTIYQYLIEYPTDLEADKDDISRYEYLRETYSDSVLSFTDQDSFNYLVIGAPLLSRKGDNGKAISLIEANLNSYKSGSREFSILSSILAFLYGLENNEREERRYLALTAISDVKGSIKENMSFRALATTMFEDGDVDRAHSYLQKSLEDAKFYSSRLRHAQASKMLPVIYEAYANQQSELSKIQREQLTYISIFTILLSVLLVLVFYLYKKSKSIGKKLAATNINLSELSKQLKEANKALALKNENLIVSDSIKEECAALFMEYCSSMISTMHKYHQSLRVLSTQNNTEALVRKIKSSEIIDTALSDFYTKFDKAILDIFPSFVDSVRSLLKDDGQPVLKSGELLNTELRVLALLRIGINDNNKIAQFLRCSITTVYTYRSKLRKRAISPNTFDSDILKIV